METVYSSDSRHLCLCLCSELDCRLRPVAVRDNRAAGCPECDVPLLLLRLPANTPHLMQHMQLLLYTSIIYLWLLCVVSLIAHGHHHHHHHYLVYCRLTDELDLRANFEGILFNCSLPLLLGYHYYYYYYYHIKLN